MNYFGAPTTNLTYLGLILAATFRVKLREREGVNLDSRVTKQLRAMLG